MSKETLHTEEHNTDKLLIVSRFSSALNACTSPKEVFRISCDVCYDLCKGIIAISDYDEATKTYGMAANRGLDKFLKPISKLVGENAVNKRVLASSIEEDIAIDFHSPHLQVIPDCMYGYSFKQIPRMICRGIEKILNISMIYSKPFYYEGYSHGTLSLMVSKELNPEVLKVIDVLSDSITHVLHRMLVENRIKESEKKYRLLAENTRDVIWTMDLNLRFTYVSPSSIYLTGYTAEEQMQNSVKIFLPPSSLKMIKEVFIQELLLEQQAGTDPNRTRVLEFQEYTKNGSIIWVEGQMSFLRDSKGKAEGIVGVSRNISERKSVNKELESFTYTIAHDLRAPLRAVDGFANIISEDYKHMIVEESQKLLDGIIQNTKKMGKLIDDLLDFSHAGQQEMRQGEVDMNQVVASIISRLTPSPPNPNIQINCQFLPTVWADDTMIRKVMHHLISNALKFSNSNGNVLIDIGATEDAESQVFFVRDNGMGFDMKYSDKLFKVFHRLHVDTDMNSTGVGLAIVAKIIQRHGGCVWAEGIPDVGAVFSFSLPNRHIKTTNIVK